MPLLVNFLWPIYYIIARERKEREFKIREGALNLFFRGGGGEEGGGMVCCGNIWFGIA